MVYFSDWNELWRIRHLKTERVAGLRLLVSGVSHRLNGHNYVFRLLEVFVSICWVCNSEQPPHPAPPWMCLSVFPQQFHVPVSCLGLCVLEIKHRASRGLHLHNSPPSSLPPPAQPDMSDHTFAKGRILSLVTWSLWPGGAGSAELQWWV